LNFESGLPDLASYNTPKRGKTYQITISNTKGSYNISSGRELFQMAKNHTHISPSKALQYTPELGFFGLQIFHLATLL
jgi:hypothetical protein